MGKVFLSYSREDVTLMQAICHELRIKELAVWTDNEIEPGSQSWINSIEEVINECACMVVIVSPDSIKSKWVNQEIEYAIQQKRRIIPLLVRGDTTHFSLISHNRIDARSNYETAINNLIISLNMIPVDHIDFEDNIANQLFSHSKTTEIEKNAKTVWVLTPDFFWDFNNKEYSKMIFDRITSGHTRMYYLYKQTDETNQKVEQLIRRYHQKIGDEWKNRVHFVPIDEINFVWATEHVLYNAYSGDGSELCIIVNPSGELITQNNYYDIPLGEENTIRFRHTFERLWNEKVSDESWRIVPGKSFHQDSR